MHKYANCVCVSSHVIILNAKAKKCSGKIRVFYCRTKEIVELIKEKGRFSQFFFAQKCDWSCFRGYRFILILIFDRSFPQIHIKMAMTRLLYFSVIFMWTFIWPSSYIIFKHYFFNFWILTNLLWYDWVCCVLPGSYVKGHAPISSGRTPCITPSSLEHTYPSGSRILDLVSLPVCICLSFYYFSCLSLTRESKVNTRESTFTTCELADAQACGADWIDGNDIFVPPISCPSLWLMCQIANFHLSNFQFR